jgi:hypothetical protein
MISLAGVRTTHAYAGFWLRSLLEVPGADVHEAAEYAVTRP